MEKSFEDSKLAEYRNYAHQVIETLKDQDFKFVVREFYPDKFVFSKENLESAGIPIDDPEIIWKLAASLSKKGINATNFFESKSVFKDKDFEVTYTD